MIYNTVNYRFLCIWCFSATPFTKVSPLLSAYQTHTSSLSLVCTSHTVSFGHLYFSNYLCISPTYEKDHCV